MRNNRLLCALEAAVIDASNKEVCLSDSDSDSDDETNICLCLEAHIPQIIHRPWYRVPFVSAAH
jgi:hypothetical protein